MDDATLFYAIGIPVLLIAGYFLICIRVLAEYERGVILRLGRALSQPKGPGLIFVFVPVDRLFRVSLRTHVEDVPSQDVITVDNVSIKVNAVVYFRVIEPMKAILQVENYLYATSQLSQTTLRSILGQSDLDQLLSERDRINQQLQEVIDLQSDPWGVKVTMVEVKHVDLPENMKRIMAKQAESERERRARVIHAEGEYQAANRLRDAARTIEKNPMALQLRYLQTLAEVGGNPNNTIVAFPVPIDMLNVFIQKVSANGDAPPTEPSEEVYQR
jgi:regulator of protease activity HflC (stomatin/prohibitin superfamily)